MNTIKWMAALAFLGFMEVLAFDTDFIFRYYLLIVVVVLWMTWKDDKPAKKA